MPGLPCRARQPGRGESLGGVTFVLGQQSAEQIERLDRGAALGGGDARRAIPGDLESGSEFDVHAVIVAGRAVDVTGGGCGDFFCPSLPPTAIAGPLAKKLIGGGTDPGRGGILQASDRPPHPCTLSPRQQLFARGPAIAGGGRGDRKSHTGDEIGEARDDLDRSCAIETGTGLANPILSPNQSVQP